MRHPSPASCLAALAAWLVALPAPALAQTEEALKRAFVGRAVAVRIDMPASHKGVDLRMDRETPFDSGEHSDRLRQYDVSLREGERVRVTHVKVKDDLVEFHLGGGGFNWVTESSTRTFTSSSRTSRERDLDRLIKEETDRDRRRRLERERDHLRHERERRDERERREVEEYNLMARERDHERALRSGSRFNVRFKKRVPPDALTPEGLEHYLGPWVAFDDGPTSPDTVGRFPAEGAPRDLRPGMRRQEVEEVLGRPVRPVEPCEQAGDLACIVATYEDEEGELEVTFVEGVLVKQRRP